MLEARTQKRLFLITRAFGQYGATFKGLIFAFFDDSCRARGEMDITGASEASSAGSIPAGQSGYPSRKVLILLP